MLLDVRKDHEVAKGAVPGAVHIPTDELRDRLGELPKDREIAVFCAAGYRSYVANRMLTQRGFRARTISGGTGMYVNFKDAGMR